MKKIFCTLFLALVAASGVAQEITVKALHPEMRDTIEISINGEVKKGRFDENGIYVIKSDTISRLTEICINVRGYECRAFMNKGSKTEVIISGKWQEATSEFKGDYAYHALRSTAGALCAQPIRADYELDDRLTFPDTLPFPKAWKLLEKRYEAARKVVKAEPKDYVYPNLFSADYTLHNLDLIYLRSCLQMQKYYCEKNALDLKKDAFYNELIGQIDLNDTASYNVVNIHFYICHHLPDSYVDSYRHVKSQQDYIAAANRLLENPQVRRRMVKNSIRGCLMFLNHDFEPFWAFVKENCDLDIVNDLQAEVDKMNLIQTGKPYVDFQMQTPEGDTSSLSDFVGNSEYVLLDFWASWCGPCLKEMPYVKQLYEEFHPKGLQIVGVSLDKSKEAWQSAIERLHLPWPQMSELKGWDGESSKVYNVHSIPETVLIDRKGTIIARGLRGEALTQKLDELLKK